MISRRIGLPRYQVTKLSPKHLARWQNKVTPTTVARCNNDDGDQTPGGNAENRRTTRIASSVKRHAIGAGLWDDRHL